MKTITIVLMLLAPVAAFAGEGGSPGYYICESMTGDTSYFSDIFLGPGDMGGVGKAFAQMLAAKYGYTGRVSCPIAVKTPEVLKQMQTQHKPYAAQRAQQGRKIVETGWTYNGAPSLNSAAPPPEPSGSSLRLASGVYCYETVASNTFYYTQTKPFAANIDPNSINRAFSDFILKTYGERETAQCVAAANIPNRNQFEANRQAVMDRYRRVGRTLKFVEVDWTPTGRVMTSGLPPALGGVPSAPKPDAQTAYERALAAQRPASSTPAHVNAARAPASASPADADTSGQKYSYCYTIGSLPHAPSAAARSNYYVSPVFAADPANRPAPAFQKMLQAANPQVQIHNATCSAPQPMAATQRIRDNEIRARTNNPYITTVEVNWKP